MRFGRLGEELAAALEVGTKTIHRKKAQPEFGKRWNVARRAGRMAFRRM
jgi:hypothetical protein